MAQTEFERGFIAGANYMQRKASLAVMGIDMPEATDEEAKK